MPPSRSHRLPSLTRIQQCGSRLSIVRNGSRGTVNSTGPTNTTDEDDFYQQVNYGPGGIPLEELAGPANTDRFINATQHVYRRFMAPLINNNMHHATQPPCRASTSYDSSRTLLRNSFCRSFGELCSRDVIVYSWRNMRHVLPHSPWSIASTMSLLAGSEIFERKIIPAVAEFMSDKELAKVIEGYMFSLG